MPAVGRFKGTPASISASEEPHTVAIDDDPFELGDLRNHPHGVGEFVVRRQNGADRAPGELAVPDLTSLGTAEAAGFADREGREIVVQQERLLVGSRQRVDVLFVLAGAERGYHQRLSLAAGEQRRAVGAGQHADLGDDVADRPDITTVDSSPRIEDVPANDLCFQLLEHGGNAKLVVFRLLSFREIVCHHLFLGVGNGRVPLLFDGNGVGRTQVGFDQRQHFLLERALVEDPDVRVAPLQPSRQVR